MPVKPILDDLIEKIEKCSLKNRGTYPATASENTIEPKTGLNCEDAAELPRLNCQELHLYNNNDMKKYQLEVINAPDGAEITWESSDTRVASVSNGLVTRKANGEATVTASFDDIVLSCKVIINPVNVIVGDKAFQTAQTALNYAVATGKTLIPITNFSAKFTEPGQKVMIQNKYGVSSIVVNAPPTTKEAFYEVKKEEISDNIFVFSVVVGGTPTVEYTSTSGLISYVASIGGSHSGKGTYKLLRDEVIKETIYLDCGLMGGDITIDLDGHKVTCDANTKKCRDTFYGIVDVCRCNLTIKNGEIFLTEDNPLELKGICNWRGKNVVIENLKINGHTECLYIQEGTTTVNGGEFSVYPYDDGDPEHDGYRYTCNCLDGSYAAGTAKFSITAGKFYKFNPAQSPSENPPANFVAEGHTSVAEDDYWVVS